MIISFSGTRAGMTRKQRDVLISLLDELKPTTVVHGDCIGADKEFHDLVSYRRGVFGTSPVIKIWPSTARTRANCNGDIIMPPKAPLDRDLDIAKDGDRLIATPKELEEVLRSGTWATIRKAKKLGKIVYIILPTGEIK